MTDPSTSDQGTCISPTYNTPLNIIHMRSSSHVPGHIKVSLASVHGTLKKIFHEYPGYRGKFDLLFWLKITYFPLKDHRSRSGYKDLVKRQVGPENKL